jgi:hypothetical protein
LKESVANLCPLGAVTIENEKNGLPSIKTEIEGNPFELFDGKNQIAGRTCQGLECGVSVGCLCIDGGLVGVCTDGHAGLAAENGDVPMFVKAFKSERPLRWQWSLHHRYNCVKYERGC